MSPTPMRFWQRYGSYYQNLPCAVWLLLIARVLQDSATAICFFLTYYFVKDLHFSIPAAGQLIAIYSVGTLLGGVSGGYLCDRFSAPALSLIALILDGIVFSNFLYISSFALLAMNLLLMGFASYTFKTANTYSALAYCEDSGNQKLTAINLLYMSANLGGGISMLVVSLLSGYGFAIVFSIAIVFGILPGAYFCRRAQKIPTPIMIPKSNSEEKQTVASQNSQRFLLFMALSILFLGGLIFAQLNSTYTIYLAEKFPAWGLNGRSMMSIVNIVLILLFQAPLIGLFAAFNKLYLAGVGGFLLGAGFFAVSVSPFFAIALLGCAVYTIGEMFLVSMTQLVCYEGAAVKNRGRNIGWSQGVGALSRMVGAILGSEIYHYQGGDAVWYYCLYVGVFSLLLGFIGKLYSQRRMVDMVMAERG